MKDNGALKRYWAEVKAGTRPAPVRKKSDTLTRTVGTTLDRNFGPDNGKRLVMTLHPDGRLELRPERSRRSESVMLKDVYRFAIQCRVNMDTRAKAAARKAKKMERLAAARTERAEKSRAGGGK